MEDQSSEILLYTMLHLGGNYGERTHVPYMLGTHIPFKIASGAREVRALLAARPLAKFVLAQRTIYTGRRDRRRLLKVRGVSDSGYAGSSDITERFARVIVCRSCLSECVLVRMRGIAGDDVAWSGEYAVHSESQRTGKP